MKTTDHNLASGSLQSSSVSEQKELNVSIELISDMPDEDDGTNAIMTVINKATRMVRPIHCRKTRCAEKSCT